GYLKSLAQRLLLHNQHRIRLVMKPDGQLRKEQEQAERNRLNAIKDSLNEEDEQAIIDSAIALKQRQEIREDLDVLPKVGIEDVPTEVAYPRKYDTQTSPLSLTSYNAGTNGLVYQQTVIPMPELSDEQMDLLPIYSACATEMGVGARNYQQTQLWQSSIVGSYSASVSVQTDRQNLEKLRGNITFSCKGLARNQQAMSDLMMESLEFVRFDELSRLRELIAQIRTQRESSIVSGGHVLAMTAASSGLSANAFLNQRWRGMTGIILLKRLDEGLNTDNGLQRLSSQLQQIHHQVLQQQRQYLLVAEEQHLQHFTSNIQHSFANDQNDSTIDNSIRYSPDLQTVNHCWTANTQVSFCAKAYPTVASAHPDAPPLTVLGGVLRNGYLHRSIREQGGAYGGGASQDSQSGTFRFFSYRDPRIDGTLDDFDKSVNWLLNHPLDYVNIEEAILGVIANMDKPSSPANEAIQAFHDNLNGRTRDSIARFREKVLRVNEADLKRVAAHYLKPNNVQTAVITNSDLAANSPLTVVSD
ncbi:MAG: insulinase family protein, partial [Porticoccaceae bacterium]